jgi:hypothetical protein
MMPSLRLSVHQIRAALPSETPDHHFRAVPLGSGRFDCRRGVDAGMKQGRVTGNLKTRPASHNILFIVSGIKPSVPHVP